MRRLPAPGFQTIILSLDVYHSPVGKVIMWFSLAWDRSWLKSILWSKSIPYNDTSDLKWLGSSFTDQTDLKHPFCVCVCKGVWGVSKVFHKTKNKTVGNGDGLLSSRSPNIFDRIQQSTLIQQHKSHQAEEASFRLSSTSWLALPLCSLSSLTFK